MLALDLIPLSVCNRPYYWLNVVKLLGLRPDKLVEKYWKQKLCNYVEEGAVPNRETILETLCLVHGEVVVETLVKKFQASIKKMDFSKVARDDYFVFLTPEGQLYDNSVLES